jgi:phage terminase large subunit
VTWNPESKRSATHKRFRETKDPRTRVAEMNWRDNPWFPAILERKRLKDLAERPDQYDHIWEGGFKAVFEGAYFATQIAQMKAEKRLGFVPKDELMRLRTFWDLGQTDSTAIWVAQFVGHKIAVLDYHEAQGQPLAYYVNWLRESGYGSALCTLPHDASHPDTIFSTRYEDALRKAGFEVRTVKNQGRGAAMQRVEAARRLFPRIWINQATTEAGVEALAAYHEKRDDKREIGLGPEHDWASHGADAFGLMCVAYEEPKATAKPAPPKRPLAAGATAWMGN